MRNCETGPLNAEPAGRPIPADSTAILFEAEAAYLVGLSHRTLQALRLNGNGPRYIKLARAVRYRRCDIDTWLETKVRANTTAPTA